MDKTSNQMPLWFKLIILIALFWNLIGVWVFLQQTGVTAPDVATIDEAEQGNYIALPLWVTIAFACAVFGGVLGCIAALLKSSTATLFFAVSLAGAAIQVSHTLMLGKDYAQYDMSQAVLPVMIIVVAVYLLAQSVVAKRKGWLT